MDKVPDIDFRRHVLDNGLEVLLHRDERVPLVHLTVHYRVGSSKEKPGYSGFAHLFEHMMFQGSENVGRNEHGRLVDEAGGNWNASTNKDRTNYYETLPSHHMKLGLWLEADRMRSLRVSEESFENQRQTVIEEKKQNYDNNPYGKAYLAFDALAYEKWAYAHPVIGDEEDLRKATVEDARRFHKTHYGADNAVLSLAGDFREDEALDTIREYFGPIAHRTNSPPQDVDEPPQIEPKFKEVEDRLATLPAVFMGYHMPGLGTSEHYALAMLVPVLGQGNSSRLYQKLIYEKNWLTSLSAGPNNYRGAGLFTIFFLTQKGVAPETVAESVRRELYKLAEDGISEEELEKARNLYAYRFVSGRAKASTIAERLARYSVYFGDAELANRDWERYQSVTPEQIRSAAEATFRRENETIVLARPAVGEPS